MAQTFQSLIIASLYFNKLTQLSPIYVHLTNFKDKASRLKRSMKSGSQLLPSSALSNPIWSVMYSAWAQVMVDFSSCPVFHHIYLTAGMKHLYSCYSLDEFVIAWPEMQVFSFCLKITTLHQYLETFLSTSDCKECTAYTVFPRK